MNKPIKTITTTVSLILIITGLIYAGITKFTGLSYDLSPNTTKTITDYNELYDPPKDKDIPYIKINNNKTFFTEQEKDPTNNQSFEEYSKLDDLGRCGTAYACIGTDIMPTKKRGKIGMIKPSGWHTVRYDDLIPEKPPYLYNRCHLIAYMLSGENANKENLITGTRYLNIEGMLPFENRVKDYMTKNPTNHVKYRITPIFKDDNLVANGVLMEAYSLEDKGELEFCVFCYNIQPKIEIDYKTGLSKPKE